jgi:Acyl-CoA dehydrogenases
LVGDRRWALSNTWCRWWTPPAWVSVRSRWACAKPPTARRWNTPRSASSSASRSSSSPPLRRCSPTWRPSCRGARAAVRNGAFRRGLQAVRPYLPRAFARSGGASGD